MKKCSMCFKQLPYSSFYENKTSKDGYRANCAQCSKIYNDRYRELNRVKLRKYNKEYDTINRKERNEWKKTYMSKYRRINKEKLNKQYSLYSINRQKTDINYRLALNLRKRLNRAIRNSQKSGSAVSDLGCSVEFLRQYLESKFKPGMSWDNYGKWHIDHVVPLVSFNLIDRVELLKAVNYTNLQPLWAKENLLKGSKHG